jgi:hypothetical protein
VRRVLGAIALAAAAGSLFPAAAAAAIALTTSPTPQRFGVRLVDVPVDEAHNPRGLRYIIDFLHPGMVIRRRILVSDQESRPATFTVYPDAAKIRKGDFVGDAGEVRSELTSWIRVQHARVKLAAGNSVMDLITIRVPKIATKGEQYGVIWVQQSSHTRMRNGFEITEINRVGIRIYLAVGKGGVPPTRWTISSIIGHHSKMGRQFLTAMVDNTGGRAVDLSGTLWLSNGPGGTSAGPFQLQQIVTLAPGQSMPVTFVVPRKLPVGPWQAKIKLVSGLNVETVAATIAFDNHTVSASWLGLKTMIWAAAIVALLLICLWAIWRVRRTWQPRGIRAVPAHAVRAR